MQENPMRISFARLISSGSLLAALTILIAAPLCGGSASTHLFSESRPAMGTLFTLYLYAADQHQASALFEAAFAEIERVEEALSNYRPSSELSRINRLAAQRPVTTDPEVFAFLERSLDFSRRSAGAFDITVGQLMRAWGFFRGSGSYPTEPELARARASVGWRNVVLDKQARTVHFTVPGMDLDPGGIGKGYAVDRVVDVLRESGVRAALVDAGGSSVYALGAPPGKEGWIVRVPQPNDKTQAISTFSLRDTSLSTSGNYEKFFRLGGRLYCHIMDPRTGEPVQGMMQTTVIAPSATDSDALSTAVFVLGHDLGRKLLENFPGASGIWVLDGAQEPRIVTWHWPQTIVSGVLSQHASVSGRSTNP